MTLFHFSKKISKNNLSGNSDSGELAERDWKIILFGFIILILVAIFFDGYLFLRVNRGDLFDPVVNKNISPETMNMKILLDVTGFFGARQKDYEELISAGMLHTDPSI